MEKTIKKYESEFQNMLEKIIKGEESLRVVIEHSKSFESDKINIVKIVYYLGEYAKKDYKIGL